MDSLYDTLLSLNTIKNAQQAWADYREALTSFMLAHAKGGGSCLIVGAGACSDLDPAQLAGRFEAVTLLDTDTGALERALRQYPAGNISALEADVLGVPAQAYRTFDGVMQAGIRAGNNGEALTEAFLNGLDRMLSGAHPDTLPEADTVVCCGVHSQLLALFARMAAVYARYADIDTRRIFQRISRYNAAIQPRFNAQLLAAARRTLILGLETGRKGMPGGIEGAAQALADISSRAPVAAETELLWPFDAAQDKLYSVRLLAIEKDGNDNKQTDITDCIEGIGS